MAWLPPQFNDFALGVTLIFWVAVLLGLVRLLWTEPRQTASKLCGASRSGNVRAFGRCDRP